MAPYTRRRARETPVPPQPHRTPSPRPRGRGEIQMPAALMPTTLLVVFGCLSLWGRSKTGRWTKSVGPFVASRLGGLMLLGAGVGLAGLGLARLVAWGAAWLDGLCVDQGWWPIGTVLVFAGGVTSAIVWACGMVPDGLIVFDPPDEVLALGLVIPSLVLGVPGGIGELLQGLVMSLGDAVAGMAQDAVEG